MSLDLSHPDTLLLAQEAGVPEERLSRPLVTWWRSNLLADPDELAVIFEPTGRFKLKFEAAIDWTTWLRDKWAEVPLVRSYASGVLEEPTVVVVEVGAHWWLSELGYQLTDEEMEIGYYAMVGLKQWLPCAAFSYRRSRRDRWKCKRSSCATCKSRCHSFGGPFRPPTSIATNITVVSGADTFHPGLPVSLKGSWQPSRERALDLCPG